MKKLLIVVAVSMCLGVAPTVKADLSFVVVPFVAGLLAGSHKNDEPHWSFRDGCAAQTVKASGGGYSYTSYDHCKTLARVYGGSEWKPTLTGSATSPSA